MTRRATLVFDLDGTIADTAPDLCAAMNHVLVREGRVAIPEETVRSLVGGGARVLMERGFRETGEPASEALLDELFPVFIEHYGANIARHTQVFPSLAGFLADTAPRARFAVCTNKPEQLSRQLLNELELGHHFEALIGGDTLPVKKPEAEPVLEAIRRAGGTPEHAVMIGDSITDVDAARNAGVPSICVSFGYAHAPARELGADRVIDHFDELADTIEALLPQAFRAA